MRLHVAHSRLLVHLDQIFYPCIENVKHAVSLIIFLHPLISDFYSLIEISAVTTFSNSTTGTSILCIFLFMSVPVALSPSHLRPRRPFTLPPGAGRSRVAYATLVRGLASIYIRTSSSPWLHVRLRKRYEIVETRLALIRRNLVVWMEFLEEALTVSHTNFAAS